jgi:hypothetical protein
MVSQNRCIFLCRIWKIEDIQIVETVPCSLFPVPCPHRQLFQQTLVRMINFVFLGESLQELKLCFFTKKNQFTLSKLSERLFGNIQPDETVC